MRKSKRITVKYVGDSEYTAVQTIPVGTEFRGLPCVDADDQLIGVCIDGKHLIKVCEVIGAFTLGVPYYFALNNPNRHSEMEVVNES